MTVLGVVGIARRKPAAPPAAGPLHRLNSDSSHDPVPDGPKLHSPFLTFRLAL